MVLQSSEPDELIFQVEFDGRFIVVYDVQPDSNAFLASALYYLDCMLKHGCAEAERATLIDHTYGHDITS